MPNVELERLDENTLIATEEARDRLLNNLIEYLAKSNPGHEGRTMALHRLTTIRRNYRPRYAEFDSPQRYDIVTKLGGDTQWVPNDKDGEFMRPIEVERSINQGRLKLNDQQRVITELQADRLKLLTALEEARKPMCDKEVHLGMPTRIVCGRCGWVGDKTYPNVAALVHSEEHRNHVNICPNHPMRALEKQIATLQEELKKATNRADFYEAAHFASIAALGPK